MNDLILALKIFNKYADDSQWPTHCERDVLMIGCDITKDMIKDKDLQILDELGFIWSDEYDCFISFRFGSC